MLALGIWITGCFIFVRRYYVNKGINLYGSFIPLYHDTNCDSSNTLAAALPKRETKKREPSPAKNPYSHFADKRRKVSPSIQLQALEQTQSNKSWIWIDCTEQGKKATSLHPQPCHQQVQPQISFTQWQTLIEAQQKQLREWEKWQLHGKKVPLLNPDTSTQQTQLQEQQESPQPLRPLEQQIEQLEQQVLLQQKQLEEYPVEAPLPQSPLPRQSTPNLLYSPSLFLVNSPVAAHSAKSIAFHETHGTTISNGK